MQKKTPIWFRDKNAAPTHSFIYDAWGNIVQESDSLNNETDYEFDERNNLVKRTQPTVKVVQPNGHEEDKRPVTTSSYNNRGIKIAQCDANNHTEGYIVNEAGQLICSVLADGTILEYRVLDANGNIKSTTDGRGFTSTYEHNATGQTVCAYLPSGTTVRHGYDEAGNLFVTTDPSGNTTRYNNDVRGNCYERYLPLGQLTRTYYDHNAQALFVRNPDNTTLTWERDFFGNPTKHKDLRGKVTQYEYDQNNRLIHLFSIGDQNRQSAQLGQELKEYKLGRHSFPYYVYNTAVTPTPAQNIFYDYNYGSLETVRDFGLGQRSDYHYDAENRRDKIELKQFGQPTHIISTQYDALGRDVITTNRSRSVTANLAVATTMTGYDAVGSRAYVRAKTFVPGYSPDCPVTVIDSNWWYSYDETDRVRINGGVLINGTVQASSQGTEFKYKDGLRTQESANGQIFNLEYDANNLVTAIDLGNNTQHVERKNHPDMWSNIYKQEVHLNGFFNTNATTEVQANENGWVTNQDYQDSFNNRKKIHTITTFDNFTPTGLPQNQVSQTWYDGHATTDTYHMDYVAFDSQVRNTVSGYRTNDNGTSQTTTAQLLYDVNGLPNAKLNSDDNMDLNAIYGRDFASFQGNKNVYYYSSNEGLLLNKTYLEGPYTGQTNRTYHFVHAANGELKGGFWIQGNTQEMFGDDAFHEHVLSKTNHTLPRSENFKVQNPVRNVSQSNFKDKKTKVDTLGWDDSLFPPLGPQIYVVQSGDSFYSIAKKFYGDDKSLASKLANANGFSNVRFQLKAGQVIRIPPFVSHYNKAANLRPYHEFVNLVVGSLTPHLDTPQPKVKDDDDPDLAGILIKAIAIGIVLAVAPYLAPALLSGIGLAATGINLALATAAIDAVGDAAVQGLAVGMGIQSKFSVNEVIETGVTGGVLAGGTKGLADVALKVSAANVASQLTEMSAGLRDKFDARGVALQVSSAVVNWKISQGINAQLGDGVASQTANTASQTAINSILGSAVTGTPIDLQRNAAQALGSTIGNEAGSRLSTAKDNEISDPNLDAAEEVANVTIEDPKIKSQDFNYSEITYRLSEINRKSMAKNNVAGVHANNWNDSIAIDDLSIPDARLDLASIDGEDIRNISSKRDLTTAGQKQIGFWHEMWVMNRIVRQGIYDHVADHIKDIKQGSIPTKLKGVGGLLLDAGTVLPGIGEIATEWRISRLVNMWRNAKFPEHPLPASLSNLQARKWYLYKLQSIPLKEEHTLQEGLEAMQTRNAYRLNTREIMKNRIKAEELMKTEPPKTLKDLARKAYARNRVGKDFYRFLVESAKKTRPGVDRSLRRIPERMKPYEDILKPHPDSYFTRNRP